LKQYTVTGMTCAACSARVEKAVSKVLGVSSCSVNLLTNTMLVDGDVTDDKIVILEPNGLKAFKNEMKDSVMSFYLITSEATRLNRMLCRKDSLEYAKKRLENDKIAFENIEGVDYYIENEDISLEELANKIYNIYVNKGE